MAKPTDAPETAQIDILTRQVESLTAILAERDKQTQRLIEAVGHLAARTYNVEFMIALRKNAGHGIESLRFAPGLTADSYHLLVDQAKEAITG